MTKGRKGHICHKGTTFFCGSSTIKMCGGCRGQLKRCINENAFILIDVDNHKNGKKYKLRSLNKSKNWEILDQKEKFGNLEVKIVHEFPGNDYETVNEVIKSTKKYQIRIYMPKLDKNRLKHYCPPTSKVEKKRDRRERKRNTQNTINFGLSQYKFNS